MAIMHVMHSCVFTPDILASRVLMRFILNRVSGLRASHHAELHANGDSLKHQQPPYARN